MGIWFYIFPFLFVLIGGPIILARRKRSGNVWFVGQILAFFGLVAAVVLIQRDTFGPLPLPSLFLLLTSGPLLALAITMLIFRKH